MFRQIQILIFVHLLISMPFAFAQSLEISNRDSIESVLRDQMGKRVAIKLDSGQELSGIVKQVTDDLTQLTELTGMEFYDAVIVNDEILAIVIRTK